MKCSATETLSPRSDPCVNAPRRRGKRRGQRVFSRHQPFYRLGFVRAACANGIGLHGHRRLLAVGPGDQKADATPPRGLPRLSGRALWWRVHIEAPSVAMTNHLAPSPLWWKRRRQQPWSRRNDGDRESAVRSNPLLHALSARLARVLVAGGGAPSGASRPGAAKSRRCSSTTPMALEGK